AAGARRTVVREDRPAVREERPAVREERPVVREERPALREDRITAREDRPPPREERLITREDRTPPREESPSYTNGNGSGTRAEPTTRPRPAEITNLGVVPPPTPSRRTEVPSLSPAGPTGAGTPARTGWLSDLLTRASRDDAEPTTARATTA